MVTQVPSRMTVNNGHPPFRLARHLFRPKEPSGAEDFHGIAVREVHSQARRPCCLGLLKLVVQPHLGSQIVFRPFKYQIIEPAERRARVRNGAGMQRTTTPRKRSLASLSTSCR
jgi:hypothetical protein